MPEVFEHKSGLSREQRYALLRRRGAVVWFTGLSGSGKSTVAYATEKLLLESGTAAYVLDGDNLRFGLNADLGFSEADRQENIRRIAHTAALFADSGQMAVVSAISPFIRDREYARALCAGKHIPFVEVYMNTPLEECIRRDAKGLYQRALAGDIANFTGISSPYEPPVIPEITLDGQHTAVDEAAEAVAAYVRVLLSLPAMLAEVCAAAVSAGRCVAEIYREEFAVEYKEDASPLTMADLESDRIIAAYLKQRYGGYAMLSEERADDASRLENPGCFIIDPLDGTKEFVKRNGEFTVNIAFAYHGKSVLGAVYVPVTDDLYCAAEGLGAFRLKGSEPFALSDNARIRVSEKRENLTVMTSRSHPSARLTALLEHNTAKIGSVVSAGSSLKGCRIAEGETDIYYRFGPTGEWDTAAVQCVVEQAGGVFLQGDMSPMRYNRAHCINEKGFIILNHIDNLLAEQGEDAR